MKKIYTSYYANVKNLSDEMVPVGISQGNNKWVKVAYYDKRLAPTWKMMKSPRAVYDFEFQQALEKLDAQEVYDSLPDNAVLLCYEKYNDWCHRRMVAEWLEEKLGIEVCEVGLKREESFPYAECNKENKGKKRKVKEEPKKAEPEKKIEPQQKMTKEEWLKSDIGGTRPDLFDVEQLESVKARRASMRKDEGLVGF